MTEASRGITPHLDQAWGPFSWLAPLVVVVWAMVLTVFALVLQQTAPSQEIKPIDGRFPGAAYAI